MHQRDTTNIADAVNVKWTSGSKSVTKSPGRLVPSRIVINLPTSNSLDANQYITNLLVHILFLKMIADSLLV